MPRRPSPIPIQDMHVSLPLPEYTKMTAHLYSPLEGRVPQGKYQSFFVERISEFFSHTKLDLAPWAGTDPGAFIVSGPPETIAILQRVLKGEVPI